MNDLFNFRLAYAEIRHICLRLNVRDELRRGQTMTFKLNPGARFRCSGHGGAWGIMNDNFEIALKVGKPAARQALKSENAWVVSECPLAATHLRQGMERLANDVPRTVQHPILLMAQAYGLQPLESPKK